VYVHNWFRCIQVQLDLDVTRICVKFDCNGRSVQQPRSNAPREGNVSVSHFLGKNHLLPLTYYCNCLVTVRVCAILGDVRYLSAILMENLFVQVLVSIEVPFTCMIGMHDRALPVNFVKCDGTFRPTQITDACATCMTGPIDVMRHIFLHHVTVLNVLMQ
jgi:hypothetical protein